MQTGPNSRAVALWFPDVDPGSYFHSRPVVRTSHPAPPEARPPRGKVPASAVTRQLPPSHSPSCGGPGGTLSAPAAPGTVSRSKDGLTPRAQHAGQADLPQGSPHSSAAPGKWLCITVTRSPCHTRADAFLSHANWPHSSSQPEVPALLEMPSCWPP